MKVLKFKDIKVYRPDVFRDYRGDYWTLWKDGVDEGDKLNFNHDKVSTSKKMLYEVSMVILRLINS